MTDIGPVRPPDGFQQDDSHLWAHANERDILREAILNAETEEARLSAVHEAQDRARQQSWHAESKLVTATTTLTRLRQEEPQRRAYAFLNNENKTTADDPIAEAEAEIAAAQADAQQLADIHDALAAERNRIQYQLTELYRLRNIALTECLIQSDEFQYLLAQHRDCFRRLRTIKTALKVIVSACHNQMPQKYVDEIRLIEPLTDGVLGYDVDHTVIECWTIAMHELQTNPETELPMFG